MFLKDWEKTDLRAIGMELFGFALLVFGNLIYNSIVKISILESNDVNDEKEKQLLEIEN